MMIMANEEKKIVEVNEQRKPFTAEDKKAFQTAIMQEKRKLLLLAGCAKAPVEEQKAVLWEFLQKPEYADPSKIKWAATRYAVEQALVFAAPEVDLNF